MIFKGMNSAVKVKKMKTSNKQQIYGVFGYRLFAEN